MTTRVSKIKDIEFGLDMARNFIDMKTCPFCNNETLKERGESPDHEPLTCAMLFVIQHVIYKNDSYDTTDDSIRFETLNKIHRMNELLIEAGLKPLGTLRANKSWIGQ